MAKVKVTYHSPKGDNKVVETRGLTFFDGQTQELDDDDHGDFLEKARDNPHFEVQGGDEDRDDLPGPNDRGDRGKGKDARANPRDQPRAGVTAGRPTGPNPTSEDPPANPQPTPANERK